MKIIKEWHTKGGAISARFYSCTDNNGVTVYFIDIEGCQKTCQIVPNKDLRSFLAYCSVYGISYRYAKFMYSYFN